MYRLYIIGCERRPAVVSHSRQWELGGSGLASELSNGPAQTDARDGHARLPNLPVLTCALSPLRVFGVWAQRRLWNWNQDRA